MTTTPAPVPVYITTHTGSFLARVNVHRELVRWPAATPIDRRRARQLARDYGQLAPGHGVLVETPDAFYRFVYSELTR